jgi:hypothetical protein
MSWLAPPSPSLQQPLETWATLRGPRKVPSLNSMAEFLKTISMEFVVIIEVSEKRECSFLYVGKIMEALYPGCQKGKAFTDLKPLTRRLEISRPINEVIASRVPATRRSSLPAPDGESFFEQLYLPFVDKNFEVRRLVVIGDSYSLIRSAE